MMPTPRLWPAWVVLGLQLIALIITVTPTINNFVRFGYMMMGPAVCALLFLIWLLLFSRLRWFERILLVAGSIALGIATGMLVDESMRTPMWIYGVPLTMLLIVVTLAVGKTLRPTIRPGIALAVVAIGWSVFTTGRLDGFDGSYWPEFAGRWTNTHESNLREVAAATTSLSEELQLEIGPNDWPEFRGRHRNSRALGVIDTDWESNPPQEMWRIPAGPAWSSFAAVAGRLYTQEQRDGEAVVCLDAQTGSELWRHFEDA